MKRLFFILAAVMMTASVMAEGHLKLKGVEIDGTIETLRDNFCRIGCQRSFNGVNEPIITTNIAGLEVIAYPLVTSQSQTVYSLVACSIGLETEVLMEHYNELQGLLAQKYGEGREITLPYCYFMGPKCKLTRGYETQALCYESALGKIYLYMYYDEEYFNAWSITLQYIDGVNEQLRLKEASDDI